MWQYLTCGVCRKGGRGVPDNVLQKEVKGKQVEKVKGTMLAAARKIKIGTLTMHVLAASVYDTKPVHMMTTIHMAASMDEKIRLCWNREQGQKVGIGFKRLNIIHEYNHGMDQVDRHDNLRGNYRPDGPWMRNHKWWWAIFLNMLGAGCTNAYLIYLKVCAAEGLRRKEIMTHLQFQEQLSEQLCKPGMRKPDQAAGEGPSGCAASGGAPSGNTPSSNGGGGRARTGTPGSAASSSEAPDSGASAKRAKKAESGDHAVRLTWAHINKCRAGFDANNHVLDDPVWFETGTGTAKRLARRDCQWCKFKWAQAGKPRDPESKAVKYEGPQIKEVAYCLACNVRFCSMQCANEFHGTKPTKNECITWPGAKPEPGCPGA